MRNIFTVFQLCLIGLASTFNIDTRTVQNYQSTAGSYFGYSVDLHKESGNSWIIVGAPLSSSTGTRIQSEQGATFKCSTNPGTSSCVNLAVDDDVSTAAENKTTQWLGGTVLSNGVDQNAVSCAPRYMDINNGFWLHGRCFVLNPDLTVKGKWNPCINRRQGNVQYGYCQAGLSAALTKGSKSFLITDVLGLGQKTGGLVVIDASLTSDQYVETSQNNLMNNDYMGYSTAWGNFSGSQFGDTVGGAPRASDLLGKVIIYSLGNGLPVIGNLPNPEDQIGSYFGGSLAAVDLNNDGWSDLLVGAPFYSKLNEEGKVYVYVNDGQGALNLMTQHLSPGVNPEARFGTSIASIGDINQDGFNDIAIGAPYGGQGMGAVYIYMGNSEGLGYNYQPVQMITPSDFSLNLQSFGASITSGLDVDGNGYPDFAVGSYQSDSTQLFRSSVVVKASAALLLNTTSVPIDISTDFCIAPDGNQFACVQAEVCLGYTGIGVPQQLAFGYILQMDSNVAGEGRAFLVDQNGGHTHTLSNNKTLTKDVTICDPYIVYLSSTTKDHLTPVTFFGSYTLNNPVTGCGPDPCSVLDFFKAKTFSNQVSFLRDCGSDNVCNSDLTLTGSIALPRAGETEYVYGLDDSLTLNIQVKNLGENAFISTIVIYFPNDIDTIGVEFQNETNPFWDKEEFNRTHEKVMFDLPTPFSLGRELTVLVKMAPKTTRPRSNVLRFEVTSNTQSIDTDLSNNNITLSVGTGMLTCLSLTGSVTPQQVFYNDNSTNDGPVVNENEIGEEVDFSFLIKNQGPSQISQVDIKLKMATKKDNDHVLYLLGAEIDGSTACDVSVDTLNLTKKANSTDSVSNRKRRAVKTLDCDEASCTNFRCKIGQLSKGQSATLKIRARVWEKTFNKLGQDTFNLTTSYNLEISSTDASLIRVPAACQDGRIEKKMHITVISQEASSSSTKESVEWWIILLSIIGGIILIAGGVAILYKAGFFERKIRAKYISSPTDNTGMEE